MLSAKWYIYFKTNFCPARPPPPEAEWISGLVSRYFFLSIILYNIMQVFPLHMVLKIAYEASPPNEDETLLEAE